jgi:hypothetical protein
MRRIQIWRIYLCVKCGANPHDMDQLGRARAMSDHYFDKPALEQISRIIQDGKEPPIDPQLLRRIEEELLSLENQDLLKRAAARAKSLGEYFNLRNSLCC